MKNMISKRFFSYLIMSNIILGLNFNPVIFAEVFPTKEYVEDYIEEFSYDISLPEEINKKINNFIHNYQLDFRCSLKRHFLKNIVCKGENPDDFCLIEIFMKALVITPIGSVYLEWQTDSTKIKLKKEAQSILDQNIHEISEEKTPAFFKVDNNDMSYYSDLINIDGKALHEKCIPQYRKTLNSWYELKSLLFEN